MASKWQLWMPFQIDRFKASPAVRAMHPAARSGYLYLLTFQWQTEDCTIPTDPFTLAEISELGDELWAQHGSRILRNFKEIEGTDRLRNDVCFVEWTEAKRIYDKRRMAAETTNARSPHVIPTVTATTNDGHRLRKAESAPRSADTGTRTGTVTVTSTEEPRNKSAPSAFVLPEWIPKDTWNDFEQMRKRKRAGMDDSIRVRIVARLDDFRIRGHDPVAIIEKSIRSNWTDVFEPSGDSNGKGNRIPAGKGQRTIEAAQRAIFDLVGGAAGETGDGSAGNDRYRDAEILRGEPVGVSDDRPLPGNRPALPHKAGGG